MFATLWYAGAVVLVLGFQGMSSEECNSLKSIMEHDIYNAYQDHESALALQNDGFYYENWKVTCEPQQLDLQNSK
jgi:hypothetical protein